LNYEYTTTHSDHNDSHDEEKKRIKLQKSPRECPNLEEGKNSFKLKIKQGI